ncbi:MAG: hypothetical protein EOM48_13260, partial [Bacilli bacterium]|nr:hypothetical protein [Bacilli bacterium]
MDTQEKLNKVIEIADKEFDGHFTLMKFTSNWRLTFGTVEDRDMISLAECALTLDEVLDKAIQSKRSVYDGLSADYEDPIDLFEK